MDRMYYINTTTPRTEVYLGNSEEDLALMPTTTTVGQAPYKKALAPENSVARIITASGLKTYILRSTGWIDITNQTSGGSGGGIPSGYEIADDDEDIGGLFNGSNPNNPGTDSGNSNTASNSDIGNLFGG